MTLNGCGESDKLQLFPRGFNQVIKYSSTRVLKNEEIQPDPDSHTHIGLMVWFQEVPFTRYLASSRTLALALAPAPARSGSLPPIR